MPTPATLLHEGDDSDALLILHDTLQTPNVRADIETLCGGESECSHRKNTWQPLANRRSALPRKVLRRYLGNGVLMLLWFLLSNAIILVIKVLVSSVPAQPALGDQTPPPAQEPLFPYPLTITTVIQVMVAVIAFVASRIPFCGFTAPSRQQILLFAVPIGVLTALEIGGTNYALKILQFSFAQILKCSGPFFVLIFALLLGLETFKCQYLVCLLLMCCGLAVASIGEVRVQLQGMVIALGAAAAGGLKWALVQIILQSHSSWQGTREAALSCDPENQGVTNNDSSDGATTHGGSVTHTAGVLHSDEEEGNTRVRDSGGGQQSLGPWRGINKGERRGDSQEIQEERRDEGCGEDDGPDRGIGDNLDGLQVEACVEVSIRHEGSEGVGVVCGGATADACKHDGKVTEGRPLKMSPLSTILCTSPIACLVLLPIAMVMEGSSVLSTVREWKGAGDGGGQAEGGSIKVLTVVSCLGATACLVFVLLTIEYLLVRNTSSLAVSVASIFKELTGVGLGMLLLADKVSWVNLAGFFTSQIGILVYTGLKYREELLADRQSVALSGSMPPGISPDIHGASQQDAVDAQDGDQDVGGRVLGERRRLAGVVGLQREATAGPPSGRAGWEEGGGGTKSQSGRDVQGNGHRKSDALFEGLVHASQHTGFTDKYPTNKDFDDKNGGAGALLRASRVGAMVKSKVAATKAATKVGHKWHYAHLRQHSGGGGAAESEGFGLLDDVPNDDK